MWLLSDSICSSEISRSVVEGTPSSSICTAREAMGQLEGPLIAKLQSKPTLVAARPRPHAAAHLQPRLLQRHQVARVLVAGLVHLAIRALPHLLQLLIVLLQAESGRGQSVGQRLSCWLRIALCRPQMPAL